MNISYPQRTSEHRTDTRAVREVMRLLPDNVVIRGMEERDYGIDMQIELFDGDSPTGNFALLQIKGTNNSFKEVGKESYDLKKTTIEYARLFNVPFFVFYVSVPPGKSDENTIRFVWLQKYLEVTEYVPEEDTQTKAINFPLANTFSATGKAKDKFIEIISDQSRHREALEVLKISSYFRRHAASLLEGNDAAISSYEKLGVELSRIRHFFKAPALTGPEIQNELKDWIKKIKANRIPHPGTGALTEEISEYNIKAKPFMDFLEKSFDTPEMLYSQERFLDWINAKDANTLPY